MDGITPVKLVPGSTPANGPSGAAGIDTAFQKTLARAIDEVNGAQVKADQQIQQLASGNVENVHQAMIALEEANIVLQFTAQVRNKVVEAYQEIMRMQV